MSDTCWLKTILVIVKFHNLSSIIKNKEVRHVVEFDLILKLPNFNLYLSSGFYTIPDNIAEGNISELHI